MNVAAAFRRIALMVAVLCSMSLLSEANAATVVSAQDGNWSDGNTWVGGVPPSGSDDVVIGSDHDVTVAAPAAAASLMLQTGPFSSTLQVNAALDVAGAVTLQSTTNGALLTVAALMRADSVALSATSSSARFVISGGTVEVVNDFTLVNAGGIEELTINTGTLKIAGDFSGSSAYVGGSGGTIIFNGTTAQNVSAFNMGAGFGVNVDVANVNGTVTMTVGDTGFGQASVADLRVANGATLNLAWNGVGTNVFEIFGDIIVDGAITGAVPLQPLSAHTLSGAGTIAGSYDLAGSSANATVQAGSNIALNGGMSFSGGYLANNGTVSVSNVSGSGFWSQGSGSTLDIKNSFTLSINASANPNLVRFSGASPTIDSSITFYDLAIAGSGSSTFSGGSNDLNVDHDLSLLGTTTFQPSPFGRLLVKGSLTVGSTATFNGGNATHEIGKNWTIVSGGTFDPQSSTIHFNGSGQTINASRFANVRFSTGSKTIGGNLDIDGIVEDSIFSTIDLGSFTMNVGGDWIGSGYFISAGGRVIFDGGAQAIDQVEYPFDVQFAGSGLKSLDALNPIFSNLLQVDAGVTLSFDGDIGGQQGTGATVRTYGNLIVNGSLVVQQGFSFQAPGTLILTDVFFGGASVQGQSKAAAERVALATGHQTISGSGTFDVPVLTVDNLSGVTQTIPLITVTRQLDLTQGVFANGANLLRVGPFGSVQRNTGHVFGKLELPVSAGGRIFDSGTLTGYDPVSVSLSGGGTGTVTVGSFDAAHPNVADTSRVLQRYWTVESAGVTVQNVLFKYRLGAVSGDESLYVPAQFTSGVWTYPAGTVDEFNHLFDVTPTTLSTFTAGERSALGGPATSFVISGNQIQVAGTRNALTITALDASGNVATDYSSDHALVFAGLGSSPNPVTAPTVTDRNGNDVPFGTATTITFASGVATIGGAAQGGLIPYLAQSSVVTASESPNGPTTSTGLSLTVTPAALSGFSLSVAPQKSGVNFTPVATITAKDAYGNVTNHDAADSPVQLTTSTPLGGLITGLGTGGNNVLNRSSDFIGGVANLAALGARYTGASGSGILKAEAAGGQTGTASFTVNAGSVASFDIEGTSGGAVPQQSAGVPFNVRITARDSGGNVASSFNGNVTLTSSATLAGSPLTSGTFSNGVLSSQGITITSAQPVTTLTATDSFSGSTGTSAPFAVVGGAAGAFQLSGPRGAPLGPQTAGAPFNLQIRAVDSFGNLDSNYTGTVTLTTNAGMIEATPGPLARAIHVNVFAPTATVTFTGAHAGLMLVDVAVTDAIPSATVTGSDSTGATGTSNSFSVEPGPLASFAVTAPGGGVIGDQVVDSPVDLEITAMDAFGNAVTSFTGTVEVSASGSLSSGGGSSVSFTAGTVNHMVVFSSPGEAGISATRTGGTETGTSNTFQVAANCGGAPSLVSPGNGASNLPVSVTFAWTPVATATSYKLFVGVDGAVAALVATTSGNSATATVGVGTISWYVEATSDSCPTVTSPVGTFTTTPACVLPSEPLATVVGEVTSNEEYSVQWSLVAGSGKFQLQEATAEDFTGSTVSQVSGQELKFKHQVTVATPYYYRVRALADCSGAAGPFSKSVRVVVVPTPPATKPNPDVTTPFGSDDLIIQKIFLAGSDADQKSALNSTFTVTADRPWMTVTPPAGNIPAAGITLTVAANPSNLPVGTNTGTVSITKGTSTTPTTVPVSVNLVTPISPTPKSSAFVEGALIVPSVGHLDGANSKWQSDVRIVNVSSSRLRYTITFTPSRTDGRIEGKQTTLDLAPGQIVALDDVVKRWYGLGSLGDGANGVLDVRASILSGGKVTGQAAGDLATVISSRTYNVSSEGTLGQYIPAVPFSSFLGLGDKKLSLQGVVQNNNYRTNIGLVEASGNPVDLMLTFYSAAGAKVLDLPVSLKAAEHQQLDQILAKNNVVMDDGRVEVRVVQGTGRVTAYASIVDNQTNDPLLVSPAQLPLSGASKYVVPGVADLDNGVAKWRTDIRVFNSGLASVDLNVTFRSQSGQQKSAIVKVQPGTIRQLDNVVRDLFGMENESGAVSITSATAVPLVVTARTYNQTTNGTYGQYIPAVTAEQAIGLGSRALEILQIEDSERFRTNLGIAEVTGKAVEVEITLSDPKSLSTPVRHMTLQPNEFVQVNGLVKQMNFGATYNGRVNVKVVGGDGRVTAYASVVDNKTQDPTFVPAQ